MFIILSDKTILARDDVSHVYVGEVDEEGDLEKFQELYRSWKRAAGNLQRQLDLMEAYREPPEVRRCKVYLKSDPSNPILFPETMIEEITSKLNGWPHFIGEAPSGHSV